MKKVLLLTPLCPIRLSASALSDYEPFPDSTGSGGDIARVASFVLYDRSVNESAGGLIDDLRFGLAWTDVTPPVPGSSALALGALAPATISGRRLLRNSC